MKVVILLLLIFVSQSYAQLIPSSEHLQFPETVSGTKDSVVFSIQNTQNHDITIDLFHHYNGRFSFSDSLFSIPANSALDIRVYYSPYDNIVDNDLVIYQSSSTGEVLTISLSGSGKYNDAYQSSTFNLFDNALKSALFNLVNNHTSLGYNTARDKMYMEIDNKKVNGQGAPVNTLECVYTGREAVGYLSRTDCQNNYGFNTEHTWPQSYFGSSEPMLSDLYHLFPTDATANSIRGNLHFGRVVSGIDWQVGGSKRGKDSLNETVFEPRDVHKGNIARSLFYFTIRHTNQGNFLDQKQEDLFRIWNHFDPADTIERRRNSDIAQSQQKRNPFIDHPEFIDRIYSFRTTQERPRYALMEALPEELFLDSTDTGDTIAGFFYLLNEGNAELLLNNIIVQEPFFIQNYPAAVDPLAYKKINVAFAPQSQGSFSNSIIINSSTGIDTIYVTGYGTGNISSVESYNSVPSFDLLQNYPNPFNPLTRIKYTVAVPAAHVTLKVFDVLGNQIAVLVNEEKTAGEYFVDFNIGSHSSGVYYYKMTTDNYTAVKKMIVMK